MIGQLGGVAADRLAQGRHGGVGGRCLGLKGCDLLEEGVDLALECRDGVTGGVGSVGGGVALACSHNDKDGDEVQEVSVTHGGALPKVRWQLVQSAARGEHSSAMATSAISIHRSWVVHP